MLVELYQSADCQLLRSCVWSELHSRQADDDDEVVQVQDGRFRLVEFQSSFLFFSLLLFGCLDLVLSDLQLLE